jgi:hypothetical protein
MPGPCLQIYAVTVAICIALQVKAVGQPDSLSPLSDNPCTVQTTRSSALHQHQPFVSTSISSTTRARRSGSISSGFGANHQCQRRRPQPLCEQMSSLRVGGMVLWQRPARHARGGQQFQHLQQGQASQPRVADVVACRCRVRNLPLLPTSTWQVPGLAPVLLATRRLTCLAFAGSECRRALSPAATAAKTR